jgi:hypothetical protein
LRNPLLQRGAGLLCVCISQFGLVSCAANTSGLSAADCSGIVAGELAHYDSYSQQFLNAATSQPDDNLAGNIVWGTRYYMESLLDAYEATGNLKYIQAFVGTGTTVMSEVQTLAITNVADPSAPGSTVDSPTIDETGWPTQLGSFAESIAIPTTDGQVSLYAQNIEPTTVGADGAIYFEVTPQDGGGLTLSWVGASGPLQSYAVTSEADLANIAAAPLVEGQSYGRIKPTGLGLPAPGMYNADSPITTIWHEQTGGILLPFVRFLVLAKRHPGLADAATIAAWQSEVVKLAAGYVDEFVPDGAGGLIFRNPIWLPNLAAGTNAAADYISVEATMRMFLYVLTGDPNQLAIARGLIIHESQHWQTNASGWLLLKYWPDMVPWTTRAAAPVGSIWDEYSFDPTDPAPVEDAATYVNMFHEANILKLTGTVGIPDHVYAADRATLQQYLYAGPSEVNNRPAGLLRGAYPTATSTRTDPLSSAEYSLSSAWYVAPEVSDPAFVEANWNWMLQFNQNPEAAGGDVGYFLKAWAMSEAAASAACKVR